MSTSDPDHYAALGLDHRCTDEQIRAAYRLLAKRHHPDVNGGAAQSVAFTQALNAAYEVLGDPERRRAYDGARATVRGARKTGRGAKGERNVAQDVHLRIDELLRGTTLQIRFNDPANPDGPETYELSVPAETPPGARFRVARRGFFEGGFVLVRVRARPDVRLKVRGFDLRCDLRIPSQRAVQGGSELVPGASGARVRVAIPRGVARGEIIRVPGEGLPKPRGGRGDLLVRILYQVPVQIRRATRR